MGLMVSPQNCYISGLLVEDYPSGNDLIEYKVQTNGNLFLLRFPHDHRNNQFTEAHKHILHGLMINGKFPPEYSGTNAKVLNNEELQKIVNESSVPITPIQKIQNLLVYLHSLQEYEGSSISIPEENPEELAKGLYFNNYNEMIFYRFTLLEDDLITGTVVSLKYGADLTNIKLTFAGLSKVIEIAEAGDQSNICFVAMSFSEGQAPLREALKTTISETGFQPVLIDEVHYPADVTINDALIAEIKKCKFLVADFTEQKHGVYFEAGFALGLKKPVIYLCKKEDFENTHFDTNHYPHLTYVDLNEMRGKLIAKIEAWIK